MAGDRGEETAPIVLLDRYRVEGLLGEGGLGTVVKAFDTRLKRMVAIKTLKRTSYAADPDLFRTLEERFAREAEAGSRMGSSNPNLVTVYDLVVDPERTQYLLLEYVPGGTLAERIKAGPLPLADALRLTADAARGLLAAHEHGIVHRDIKPANLFLSEDDRAQVGDFGIAQIDDISGRTHATTGHPGTPLYMSPEQAHSTGYVRPSSDQYSLGLVLFEMLTGTAYKRLEQHEADALLAQQPTAVATIVKRMLATEPGNRYPGMAGVLAAIQAIASVPEQVQVADPPTLPAPTLDDAVTKQQTPSLNLHPVPPVVDRPPPAIQIVPRYSRRMILVGTGALVLAAGTAGAAVTSLRKPGVAVMTATPVGTGVASTASSVATTTGVLAAAATSAPSVVATVAPPTPIVITAPPPIIITATPLPTVIPTATAVPTETPIPSTSVPPTTTPRPLPATSLPAARQSQLAVWSDPQNRFQVQYPLGWGINGPEGHSVVDFSGSVNGITTGVQVYAYPNAQSNPVQQLNAVSANPPGDRKYVYDRVQNAVIGGESGAFMSFRSYGSSASDIHEGGYWTVQHLNTLYEIEGYSYGVMSKDTANVINAIVGSFTFSR